MTAGTLTNRIYDTRAILGLYKEFAPVPNYWLDLCFPEVYQSQEEEIDFGKMYTRRKLAPFVMPSVSGRPIFSDRVQISRFKPAYIKPKDAVTANRVIKKRPEELLSGLLAGSMSPMQRYQANVADIFREHAEAIQRRWEWMAAQAILYGQITISGENYPTQIIDFERDPGNSTTLTGAAQWGQPGVSIINTINAWRQRGHEARFAGPFTRLTVGASAWKVMSRDAELMEQLNTLRRGTTANFNTGIQQGLSVEYMGTIGGGLEVYQYSDWYEDESFNVQRFMDPRDVVLTGPNVQGIRAFGAIQDRAAQFQALSMFPKMWDEDDPSATYCMTQSAPLMVPVNPNNTLRARVIETV